MAERENRPRREPIKLEHVPGDMIITSDNHRGLRWMDKISIVQVEPRSRCVRKQRRTSLSATQPSCNVGNTFLRGRPEKKAKVKSVIVSHSFSSKTKFGIIRISRQVVSVKSKIAAAGADPGADGRGSRSSSSPFRCSMDPEILQGRGSVRMRRLVDGMEGAKMDMNKNKTYPRKFDRIRP